MFGIKSPVICLLIIVGAFFNSCLCTTGQGRCAFLDTDVALDNGGISIGTNNEYNHVPDSKKAGEVLPDNTTMQCNENVFNCFALWLKNGTNKITLLKQGCWIQSDDYLCSTHSCMGTDPNNKNLSFCCCKGDFCNRNLTDNYKPPTSTQTPIIQTPVYVDAHFKEKTIVYAISPIFIVAIVIVFGYLAFRLWLRTHKESTESIHLIESSTSPSWELDSLKLNTLINGGRYGEVWKGTLSDIDVAVKVFTGSSQKQYYYNEKDIYLLPHMEHESIPHFLGAEERVNVDGISQYWLVMEYVPQGTLTHYLKNNKVEWQTMCKMCRTVASGLAHLHTDISKFDKLKPAIAHRDLNTRNILVRPDLNCVICDFGFAMQINGSNYMKNGNQEVAEQSSLNDVGTIRYMPPEVLEGAVNLRDCEASLKQIDVYALGLVFWEIGTRCSDLYQGLPVPEYQLPFQAELGPHPSFDDMQMMVSKNKSRPLFPDIWKDTNQAIRALKETIEDCWDQDGEARLTAMCVEERVQEMEALWSVRHKIGVTPTINTTNFQPTALPVVEKKPELCNTNIVNENEIAPNQTLDMTVQEHNARNLEKLVAGDLRGMPGINIPNRSHQSVSDNSVSTATTDTLLSPMESIRPPPNVQQPPSWSMYCSRPKVFQPHQGKNPTVERNTHKRSDEDLEVQGNTLVNKNAVSPCPLDGLHADSLPLMGTDSINTQQSNRQPVRTAPRIPFMQNNVASESLIVRPKQPNTHATGSKTGESRSFFGKIFRGPKLSRLSFKKKDPVNLQHNKNHHMTSHATGTQSAGASNLEKATSNLNSDQHNNLLLAEEKSNISGLHGQCGTEVYLNKGQPVVRTTEVPLNGHLETLYSDSEATEPKKYITSSNTCEETVPLNDSKQNSTDLSTDLDESVSSSVELTYKARRPNSLVINKPHMARTGLVSNVAHHVSSPDFTDAKHMC